jgi:phosphoribosylglycinamide formyltransferase-1
MKKVPKILPFASGTKNGGGSGFENLFNAIETGRLKAEMVGVASNYLHGGVRERADRLKIPFYFIGSNPKADDYQRVAEDSGADFFPLSGLLKKVEGLDLKTKFNSKTVFNIHPGILPLFGGPGMHGHYVHEAIFAAYLRQELTSTEICMHFVNEKFDDGPVFFRLIIPMAGVKSPEELGNLVNVYEHIYQPYITDLVVNKKLTWDGEDPLSLSLPLDYEINQWIS